MFDIAVILINYNSAQHSINCIKSIVEKTDVSLALQIIITDNNSEPDDFIQLKHFCENSGIANLNLYRSPINTGFGGGNMHGVQYANAKYLAFVNNDSLFLNDCLSLLKKALDENPEIGIAGAQAFKENGDFLISLDHFASPTREILGRKFLETINPEKYPKRKTRYTNPVKVNFVPGSFMFLRAADFYTIGGFDTNIFLYYEETDLCLRLAKQQKFAYLIPKAEFTHFHGASTPRSIAIKKELKISLLYLMRKHYGLLGYRCVLNFLCTKYFFSALFKPKNASLFFLLLAGAPLSRSLKQMQQIRKL